VVCRARGARRPLFRRSQFHAGAALTARKALDASDSMAAMNKCSAQSNKSPTRVEATKKRRAPLAALQLETSYEVHSTGGGCCSGGNGRTS
jgi:hypothetical protein